MRALYPNGIRLLLSPKPQGILQFWDNVREARHEAV